METIADFPLVLRRPLNQSASNARFTLSFLFVTKHFRVVKRNRNFKAKKKENLGFDNGGLIGFLECLLTLGRR
jgi:hypothetical protein